MINTNFTLQDSFDEITANPLRWPASSRRQMLDALKRLSRLLEKELGDLPADETALAAIMDGELKWQRDGFKSEIAFSGFRSRVLRATRDTNRASRPRYTRRNAYSAEWDALFTDIEAAVARGEETFNVRRVLAHLAGYANWRGVGPDGVTSDLLAELIAEHRRCKAQGESIGLKPVDYARKAVESAQAWNALVRQKNRKPWLKRMPVTMLEWPGQKVAVNPPLSDYPESFQQDVLAYLESLSRPSGPEVYKQKGDVVPSTRKTKSSGAKGRTKPLSPATITNNKTAILQLAGAVVRRGSLQMEKVVSLASICTLSGMGDCVNDYHHRQEAKPDGEQRLTSASNYQIAQTVIGIAKHWCGADENTLELMKEHRDFLKTESCGAMSVIRKQLLRQFDETYALRAWFDAPRTVFDRAEKRRRSGKTIRSTDIADVEVALLCRVLMILPVRRLNAVTVRFRGDDKNIVLPRHGKEKGWLQWRPGVVKNKRHLRAELDRITIHMVRVYLEHYRPVYLKKHPETEDKEFLFPGLASSKVGHGHRDPGRMGQAFKKRMAQCGLEMTLHLARHLAGKILVDYDLKNIPVVAELLGDTIETVRKFYVDDNTERASMTLRDIVSEGVEGVLDVMRALWDVKEKEIKK